MSNLSRRFVITSAAALPALAIPAALAATPETPAVIPQLGGPTRIAKLWERRQELCREYNRLHRAAERLEKKVDQIMPDPHPSIAFSPENEAEGLRRPDHRGYVRKYIEPHLINKELYSEERAAKEQSWFAELDDPSCPLWTDAERERRSDRVARLKARYELSEMYREERRLIEEEMGLRDLYERGSKICDKQVGVENSIRHARPLTRSDLRLKFALYDDGGFDHAEELLIRDLRLLFDNANALGA